MSEARAYFGHLRLGDFKSDGEKLIVEKTDPSFRGGTGSSRAHYHYAAPASFYEMELDLTFRRGHLGAESVKSFWRRMRLWQKELLGTVLPLGAQTLAFVRDPDGGQWGEADETTSSGVYVVGPGDMTLATLDPGWSVGDYVLLIDSAQPAAVNEVVEIEALPGGSDITITTASSYSNGSTVLRLDWHCPASVVMGKVELPVSGPLKDNAVVFPMTFRSVSDPVEGMST